MNTFLSFFTAVLALVSFPSQATQSTISGNITNGAGKKIYFEQYFETRLNKLDSATLDKSGKFAFQVNHEVTDYYRISIKPTDFIVFIIKPGDKITVKADANALNKTYTVKGSEFSQHLKEFSDLVNGYIRERDTISARFKRAIAAQKDAESEKLGKELGDAYNKFTINRDAFLNKYPSSPALFAALSHINPATDYDQLKKIEKAMERDMPNSWFRLQVKMAIKKIDDQRAIEEAKAKEAERQKQVKENLMPGKMAPDFTMADSNGVQKKLSALRGQYVLLDFWASWCGPCRKENPNVIANYAKYKDKGFTVMSVSLDFDRKKWLDAIKKDKLIWPNHVSELKGWQTSVLPSYGITGIPFTVLIDKEGKIVQTNLRGPALEEKLKEIFGY
ncbi:MAG TPA: redoxin family protein [Flavobacteriales bacterium]|nr:redoxin family protein [Flavobacteriales bacterium]